MLVIVNPYATTVSNRLRNLVVYTLGGRYAVEAVETRARAHATEPCREAVAARYDLVVAFGGDGTINEAANGLAGSDVPLTCLPGGSTNVLPDARHTRRRGRRHRAPARARRRLPAPARRPRPRRRPLLHLLLGDRARRERWSSASTAVRTSGLDRSASARRRAWTRARYRSPCSSARARSSCRPCWRGCSRGGRRPWRDTASSRAFPESERPRWTAAGGRSFPLEVDGDYLGERDEVVYGVRPRALRVGA